jgi:hypothetical protein
MAYNNLFGTLSSGIQCHTVCQKSTDFSENMLSPSSCLVYLWTVKMEATCSSKMSVDLQLSTQHYITEDRSLHNHNFKSYKDVLQDEVKRRINSENACPYYSQ